MAGTFEYFSVLRAELIVSVDLARLIINFNYVNERYYGNLPAHVRDPPHTTYTSRTLSEPRAAVLCSSSPCPAALRIDELLLSRDLAEWAAGPQADARTDEALGSGGLPAGRLSGTPLSHVPSPLPPLPRRPPPTNETEFRSPCHASRQLLSRPRRPLSRSVIRRRPHRFILLLLPQLAVITQLAFFSFS